MMPSYKLNRLASVFFVVFSFVGTFLIMNLLTAVIYNQFRGYLRTTLQNSLNRRQVAFFGAFHKLLESDKVLADESRNKGVKISILKSMKLNKSSLGSSNVAQVLAFEATVSLVTSFYGF